MKLFNDKKSESKENIKHRLYTKIFSKLKNNIKNANSKIYTNIRLFNNTKKRNDEFDIINYLLNLSEIDDHFQIYYFNISYFYIDIL